MEREQAIKFMRDLLKLMVEKGGSDLFITVGFPPAMKIHGKMTPSVQDRAHAGKHQSIGYTRS